MEPLKKKVILKRNESAEISDFARLIVSLNWTPGLDNKGFIGPDFDLMAFYEKKDGKTGGVYDEGFNLNKDDMGHLDKFPYMQLSLHAEPDSGNENEASEKMEISKLDGFKKVYFCVLDFDMVQNGELSCFGINDSYISVETDTGDNFEVPMDEKETLGHVALICSIDNTSGSPKLVNENKILTLGVFAESIPGAGLIVTI